MEKVICTIKKVLCTVFVCFFVLCNVAFAKDSSTQHAFSSWNKSAIISTLQEYMKEITDTSGKKYIPVQDRVAVFDMDGTLIGEQGPIYFEWMLFCHRVLNDPDYTATKEHIAVAGGILQAAREKKISPKLAMKKMQAYSEVFSGMSIEDYRSYVKKFLKTHADGFENLPLSEAYFRPMAEVVAYLKAHDFTVYVVSGTDRDATRVMIAEVLKLPLRQIIGSDWFTKGSNQGEHKYVAYQLGADEKMLRDSKLIIMNNVIGKTIQIAQEIGQKPVLAFGNTSGDFSMFTYTTYQNKYPAKAFCLIPDDDAREYAFADRAKQLMDACEKNAWYPISMKNDFKVMYAKGVKKNQKHTPWMDKMLQLYKQRSQE